VSTVGFPIAARFAHPGNGYKGDQDQAARHLTPGRVYMVHRLDVGFSSSTLYLDGPGLSGIGFNTVLFEAAEAPNDWDDDEDPAELAAEAKLNAEYMAEDEGYCAVCGANLACFTGYDGWQHFRGPHKLVTGAEHRELFTPDDGHGAVVAWRQPGDAQDQAAEAAARVLAENTGGNVPVCSMCGGLLVLGGERWNHWRTGVDAGHRPVLTWRRGL